VIDSRKYKSDRVDGETSKLGGHTFHDREQVRRLIQEPCLWKSDIILFLNFIDPAEQNSDIVRHEITKALELEKFGQFYSTFNANGEQAGEKVKASSENSLTGRQILVFTKMSELLRYMRDPEWRLGRDPYSLRLNQHPIQQQQI